jgi:small-conductance mechanosensitive channel
MLLGDGTASAVRYDSGERRQEEARMEEVLSNLHPWMVPIAILGGVILLALIGHLILFTVAKRLASRTPAEFDNSLIRHAEKPARVIIPLLALYLAFPLLKVPADFIVVLSHITTLGLIASISWLLIALTEVAADLISTKYKVDEKDNLAARRIRTQFYLLRRVVAVIVGIIALASMLMTFPSIQHIGATLFASAGVAGLIIGLAARPTISSLLGGIQIALTEPIRIDDVVIVEGEWGWIEEITFTYVIVRIWDLRRLVVPLSYFIERPFQNWTRRSADLLGTVFLYTDYSVPVEKVRQELYQTLKASSLWDGKTWGLQVTNTSEHTMELRALMSASDSGAAWDLRCYVREKLVEFVQQNYPDALPKTRAEIRREPFNKATPLAPVTGR